MPSSHALSLEIQQLPPCTSATKRGPVSGELPFNCPAQVRYGVIFDSVPSLQVLFKTPKASPFFVQFETGGVLSLNSCWLALRRGDPVFTFD